MKVYTRTGDTGETSLYGGARAMKSSEVFDVLGTFDELNATLGLLSTSRTPDIKNYILEIQNELFTIGAFIANAKTSESSYDSLNALTQRFEKRMDNLDSVLSELKNFILPVGTHTSVYLHLARAVCRRLERDLVAYYSVEKSAKGSKEVLRYVNRLSDYLFILARYANFKMGVSDYIWKGLNEA